MCMSDQGSTERRPWEGTTGFQGAKISRNSVTKQLDGAGSIVSRADRRVGAYFAVAYCRRHNVPSCEGGQSFEGFSALEELLCDGREPLLQVRLKIFAIDMTLYFQVGYSTRKVMRGIRPCVISCVGNAASRTDGL